MTPEDASANSNTNRDRTIPRMSALLVVFSSIGALSSVDPPTARRGGAALAELLREST
ncbi:MAG: hypothetical protein WA238_16955 [Methylocella sp.]